MQCLTVNLDEPGVRAYDIMTVLTNSTDERAVMQSRWKVGALEPAKNQINSLKGPGSVTGELVKFLVGTVSTEENCNGPLPWKRNAIAVTTEGNHSCHKLKGHCNGQYV